MCIRDSYTTTADVVISAIGIPNYLKGEMIKSGSILVDVGIEENDAKLITDGFLKRQLEGRPLITLKLATSLDGRIACHSGDSKWVTGEIARKSGHLLRANHDGILVGATTAARDNPNLTCRLPGMLDS